MAEGEVGYVRGKVRAVVAGRYGALGRPLRSIVLHARKGLLVPPVDRDHLRELLRTGPIWGAEVDIRFRVLALTVEPGAEAHPHPGAGDRRLQVLLYPVSALAASLVEQTDDGPVVRRFDETQLVEVVAAFDGAHTTTDPLPDRPVDLDALSPRLSLRGQATVGDGFRHHLHLHLPSDELALDLWASFDEVEVRGPDEWDEDLPG